MSNMMFYGHNQNQNQYNVSYITIFQDPFSLITITNIITDGVSNIVVDWDDGSSDTYVGSSTGEITHNYSVATNREIKITSDGTITAFGSQVLMNVTAIDIKGSTSLGIVVITTNNISSVDLSDNIGLLNINFAKNNISTIDISNNQSLKVVNLNENNLSVTDINNILINLDSFGLSGGTCLLGAQSPLAPPSGAGIIAKNNLISKSWGMVTD